MYLTLCIIINHWFADFVLQTDKMAINKSKNNNWLATHITCYSFGMLPVALYGCLKHGLLWGLCWLLGNAILHFVTDYFTSRITSKLWQKGERHWFFVMIGFDQVIHYACLILSWQFMIN